VADGAEQDDPGARLFSQARGPLRTRRAVKASLRFQKRLAIPVSTIRLHCPKIETLLPRWLRPRSSVHWGMSIVAWCSWINAAVGLGWLATHFRYHPFFLGRGELTLARIVCEADRGWIDTMDLSRSALRVERPSTIPAESEPCVRRPLGTAQARDVVHQLRNSGRDLEEG